jgi:hypothetical protein
MEEEWMENLLNQFAEKTTIQAIENFQASHPPITEVRVFVQRRARGLPSICRKEVAVLVNGAKNLSVPGGHVVLPLDVVGVVRMSPLVWDEYRVIGWQKAFPDCMVSKRSCSATYPGDSNYIPCTFFDSDDEYGYFGDGENSSKRGGYSVMEGSDYFVNFLEVPTEWTPENHREWTPEFKSEVFQLLLVFHHFDPRFRDLRFLFIKELAKLHM